MTEQDCWDYRRRCPYDAMGDFSCFVKEKDRNENNNETGHIQPEHPAKQRKQVDGIDL